MSWSVGYDHNQGRDIGYGVPSWCDHPGCMSVIDRGLSYVCGGEPYGGERGCGLYFCSAHRGLKYCRTCENPLVRRGRLPAPTYQSVDHPDWIHHKFTDESWGEWRENNPKWVETVAMNYSLT
jgi:hypothetical protein